MPKNRCFWTGVLEKTHESPLDCKELQPVNTKGDQSWIFIGRTDVEADTLATWCEELTHLKGPWCWERLKAGGEGDDRGWDSWMASLTQWTWVWVNSGSWWWTGRPGVLWFMGSQRTGHEWLNWTELAWNIPLVSLISLKRSLVFPVLLFSSISLHWSLRKTFLNPLCVLWNSVFKWVYLSFCPFSFSSPITKT